MAARARQPWAAPHEPDEYSEAHERCDEPEHVVEALVGLGVADELGAERRTLVERGKLQISRNPRVPEQNRREEPGDCGSG
jgi:hypothetical protein